ncbi:MAG TPA: hemolysin family protein [Pyrinomonadaceae bacterium]|jgi:CBS domain containing-hemolysin-like protein
MQTALYILTIFVLVFANGFFVAAEFALVGVRRSRIETLAAGGDRRAQRLLGLLNNLNAYLSASQLGITLASLALGWIGEPTFAHLLEAPLSGRVSEAMRHTIAFLIAFMIITTLHIVLGEQAPKLLGLERAERVALATALPMRVFYRLFRLPIHALDWASARTVRLFGLNSKAEHASIYTKEELQQLIEASRQGGQLDTDVDLIKRIFDFSSAQVREAMIPRTNIVALPVTATIAEAENSFCESGYSRLPVYHDRLDEVVGVLFLKDLVPCLRKDPAEFKVEKLLHAPTFVTARARLGAVLAQMQASKSHMAFVVDEHGGIEGIVTLEDLLEEIVGEINDEYDEEVRAQIVEDADGTFMLDGMLAVRDANRRFGLNLPEEAGYTTMAGFLLDRAGRLLRQGESIEHQGARFMVERVDRRRIRRIRFTPAARDGQALSSLLLLACGSLFAALL